MENINEQEQKKAFALALLKTPDDPFQAALVVFGDDTGRALLMKNKWANDPEVVAYRDAFLDELGDMHFLPSKADLARKAWDLATSAIGSSDDKLKAMRLYGDIRGFIEKQGTVVNTNILTNNKVMIVKDHGTAAEWEGDLVIQQQKLIEDAGGGSKAH